MLYQLLRRINAMKVTNNTDIQDIMDYAYFHHVKIKFKNGVKKSYFILDTALAEDGTNSGKDEVVYMTNHDKDPKGFDRYAGEGIPIDQIDSIVVTD